MRSATMIVALAATTLQTQAFDLATIGVNLAAINTGVMQALQSDMSSTTTDCYVAATITGTSITTAFNTANFSTGAFNVGDFSNYGQIVAINLMDQFTRCGFNNYLVQLDQALSKLP